MVARRKVARKVAEANGSSFIAGRLFGGGGLLLLFLFHGGFGLFLHSVLACGFGGFVAHGVHLSLKGFLTCGLNDFAAAIMTMRAYGRMCKC
jgi:hypothetical protein